MAPITWNDVSAIASDVACVAAPAQDMLLSFVNTCLNCEAFGGEESIKLKLARTYLAAHLAVTTKETNAGAIGAVTEEQVDEVRRRYQNLPASDSIYGTTLYGRSFQMFARLAGGGACLL